MRGRRYPLLAAGLTFLAIAWLFPNWWCGRGARNWFEGDLEVQHQLARTVVAQVNGDLGTEDYFTGSELFNGEWLFGTYVMAGIGLCNLSKQHPECLPEFAPAIERCIDQLLSEKVRAFDSHRFGNDALATLEHGSGHAAYLGYLNCLLGLYREIAPENRFTTLNDRITAALVHRMLVSPNGLVATYPNEWYPVDNCPVLSSIIQHSRITPLVGLHLLKDNFVANAVDPKTGLLTQALNEDGSPRDLPRGSGTTLGLFFLGNTFPELSAKLYAAVKSQLISGVLGFGAIREYPHGTIAFGDIDSGPVVFGFGFSASGFGMSGARRFEDWSLFRSLYASAFLVGAPVRNGDRLEFVSGGPLGNAILLAVMSTPRGATK